MELQHDPLTKQKVKDALYNFLYEPVKRRYQDTLKDIIQGNARLLQSSNESFIYKGTTYALDEDARLPRKMDRLHPALHAQMDLYLNDMQQLNEIELPYVLGFINQVLNASNDFVDYLRVLPNSVHRPIDELIASCPCHNSRLSGDQVRQMQEANKVGMELMKKRQVLNLLL